MRRYTVSRKALKEEVEKHIFYEVDEPEDVSDWAIFDNDKWFGRGDGIILEENWDYPERIFSEKHEQQIHNALDELEGKELLAELKKITGLDYVKDQIHGYNTWQDIYYPKKDFDKEDIDWFESVYFGDYVAYQTEEEDIDPPYIWYFGSERRSPEQVIAAETRLPKESIIIKHIKGYKQVPIYDD